MRHWATCHRPTGGLCSRRCGCTCHRPPHAPPNDWRTEVDPDPLGVPAHWWALGALTSTAAGIVDRCTRFRRSWWWPWP